MFIKDISAKIDKRQLLGNAPLFFLAWFSIGLMPLINRADIPGTIHNPVSPWDQYIPFILIFVIPYMIYFVYFAAGWFYLFLLRPRHFVPFGWAMSAVGLTTGLINVTYQTSCPRAYATTDSLLARILDWHHTLNRPLTCLPSQHVSLSIVVSFSLSLALPRYKWLWWILGISSILSTVFLKKHYLPDVAIAILIGSLFAWSANFIYSRKSKKDEQPNA